MKKTFIILLLLTLLAIAGYFFLPHLPPIHRGEIYLDYSLSSFQDFMEIDGMAYSRCRLTLINKTGKKAYVHISATASLFDRHKLYAQKELSGYTLDMQTDVFPVEPGENWIYVYFGAPYGGTYQRGSRLLPWNIRIKTIDENDPGIIAVSEEQSFGAEVLLSAADIAAGITSAEYDVDGDGQTERLDICITDTETETANHEQTRSLNLSIFDEGIQTDKLEIPLSPRIETTFGDILIYDFGFKDGSSELILQFQQRYEYNLGYEESAVEEPAVSLIRIANGQLLTDPGSIYGSGGYHIEPAEIYNGRLHSISGNRVTIDTDTIPPIRVDLAETLLPET